MKFDLHIHSKYSADGKLDPQLLIKLAKKAQLKGIAITDHNNMQAFKKVKSTDQFVIIPGIEISTCCGHVIALGVQEPVPPKLSIDETITKIHELGGIAIAAHPYRSFTGLKEKNVKLHNFDVIEVLNGRCVASNNNKAMNLAKTLNRAISAGSDAHFADEIGRAYLETEYDDIIDAILHHNVMAYGRSRPVTGKIVDMRKIIKDWIVRGFKKI